MVSEFVKLEIKDRLWVVTINRPEVMNALNLKAHHELDEIFDAYQADDDAWCAILTGAGERAFTAGNDLKWQALVGGDQVRKDLAGLNGGFGGLTRRYGLYKPLIAAVNGLALGGGTELALACDIVIADQSAEFGLPEPRVGMVARQGGIHRLVRHLPHHQAMGMLLTGRRVPAAEAHRMGLVNELAPAGEVMAVARRWAAQVLQCAPLALWAAKECALTGRALGLDEAMEKDFACLERMFASKDYREGPIAFAEKRKPRWSGS